MVHQLVAERMGPLPLTKQLACYWMQSLWFLAQHPLVAGVPFPPLQSVNRWKWFWFGFRVEKRHSGALSQQNPPPQKTEICTSLFVTKLTQAYVPFQMRAHSWRGSTSVCQTEREGGGRGGERGGERVRERGSRLIWKISRATDLVCAGKRPNTTGWISARCEPQWGTAAIHAQTGL